MEGEWIVVTKKSRTASRHHKIKKGEEVHQVSQIVRSRQHESNLEQMILNSDILKQVLSNLQNYLQRSASQLGHCHSDQSIKLSVNVLGMGNFVQYKKPHIQYLFLKHLILKLLPLCLELSLNAYDPIFTPACTQELLNMYPRTTFLPLQKQQNVRESETIRLYYMIHCEKELYEEVLSRQQGRVIVVGNSLKAYNQRLELIGKPQVAAFEKCGLKEENLPDFLEAFNDTCFMWR